MNFAGVFLLKCGNCATRKEGLITIRAPGGPANIATITNPKTLKLRAF